MPGAGQAQCETRRHRVRDHATERQTMDTIAEDVGENETCDLGNYKPVLLCIFNHRKLPVLSTS